MTDLLIKGATIADGTGTPPYPADIAIVDGRISAIGKLEASAREVIDARGALVTPGFIDVHTHYDGQFIWDQSIEPSFSHGVTTAIAGNCGVGFAPVKPEHRQALVELMEGVEEIPGVVLDEGLDWQWRSFPDYLNRLEANHYSMDIAVHITHAPLRVYVMGERALNHEPATAEDITAMRKLVGEAMVAGAIGFSGARCLEHLSSAGAYVPGTFAADDELLGLAEALGKSGRGVFQIIPLGSNGDLMGEAEDAPGRLAELERLERIARISGRPVNYTLNQFASDPDDWRMMLDASRRCAEQGLQIHPHVATRGIGAMTTLDGYHIFMLRRSYHEIAHLPLAERVAAMRHPERRAAILSEKSDPEVMALDPKLGAFIEMLTGRIANIYPMTLPLNYEPTPEMRLSALAEKAGVSMEEYLYDHYTADGGHNVCASFVLNYANHNLQPTGDMIASPLTSVGLGDGGAHLKMSCDSSYTTFLLSFWGRDRRRGPTLPVEYLVQKMTKVNADLYGLSDRGTIEVGKRADINVIDFQRLALKMPRMCHDLPQGSARILQGSEGYLATLVNGVITRRHDTDTGARPGRLVRSRTAAPA